MNNVTNITKFWISGFTQADGSFVVGFEKRNQGFIPYRPRPMFVLSQHVREENLFREIQKHLNVGRIQITRNEVNFIVSSLEEITNVIIPLFDKHPVRDGKYRSFLVFKKVVEMMNQKEHTTLQGFMTILELSYFTHNTSNRTLESKQEILTNLKNKFKDLPSISEEFLLNSLENSSSAIPMDKEFVRGLVDGDGSFNFSFKSSRRRLVPNFTVTMGKGDEQVLHDLVKFFDCGKVYSLPSQSSRFQIENVNDLLQKVCPFFEINSLITTKQEHFITSVEAWKLLANHSLTDDVLIRLVDLVYNMNQGGKSRKLTKTQYLAKFIQNH